MAEIPPDKVAEAKEEKKLDDKWDYFKREFPIRKAKIERSKERSRLEDENARLSYAGFSQEEIKDIGRGRRDGVEGGFTPRIPKPFRYR